MQIIVLLPEDTNELCFDWGPWDPNILPTNRDKKEDDLKKPLKK